MGLVVVYLVILVAAFFLLVVRPQRRQMASHRALVASLEVGEEVVTTGGILGTIHSLDDEIAELEVAPGVVLRIARAAIARRVPTDLESAGGSDAADDGDAS
ncbi:MAG TPA: preprotein translocase subunit YajC [Acidimicrobiia bacterium]|nr:preprotein translocase subunit YajC [Acidimicrobiia bacterium]